MESATTDMGTRFKLSLLLLAGLGLLAAASRSAGESTPVSDPAGPALAKALDTIDAQEIGADVHFLASDALEGRDTPGRGLRVAARFLRARLQRLGWSPGAGDGWFQRFPLVHRAVDPERSVLRFELPAGRNLDLVFGEDYLFSNGEVWDHALRAGVIGAGRGASGELGGVDLAGKWALVVDSGDHAALRRRILMKADARGLLVLPGSGKDSADRLEKLRRSAEWALRGTVEYPDEANGSDELPMEHFHQVHLTERGFARLGEFLGESDAEALARPGRELDFTVLDHRRLPGDRGTIEVENVCGLWPGSDPELAREVILVSAHYDHDGVKLGQIYNGADDNASGTSGLLALAEALSVHGPMRRSVMLVWVAGEEKGLFGSRAWVESPTLPAGFRAVADINIDMIGRNAPGELYVTPSRRHRKFNGLVKLAMRFAPLEGFAELGSADRYYDRSDHANFARLGIPVVFLFNGEHEDYHKPTDTYEKIDSDKIRRVTRLVLRLIDALQTDHLEL